MNRRIRSLLFSLCLVLTLSHPVSGETLQLRIGSQTYRVQSRTSSDRDYFPVLQIAALLELTTESRAGVLLIRGPRGQLRLEKSRPLVRHGDQYLLLSDPVWEEAGEWFATEDLLSKALTLVMESRIDKVAPYLYQVEETEKNRVSVQVVNYPDHVSIVFVPTRNAPVRVREFRRSIRVQFGEFQVEPNISPGQASPLIVSEVRFDSAGQFGSFEIVKGPEYEGYREYALEDPDRKVVDVYAAPRSVVSLEPKVEDLETDVQAEIEASRSGADDRIAGQAPEFKIDVPDNVLTIDPGHGGEDYGILVSPEVLEKSFNLEIASRVPGAMAGLDYDVSLTRSRDMSLSDSQRSSVGNSNQSRAFVSIHCGASPDAGVGGPVVYVHRYDEAAAETQGLADWDNGQRAYLRESRRLASLLQTELNQLFGAENTVSEAPLSVLAPILAPAVTVEVGYLSNPADLERLRDPAFQASVAERIGRVLKEFLE